MNGRLIVIDGPDGAGKTTQVARLAAHLKEHGSDVVVLREPGGTAVGEAIRDLLLHSDTDVTAKTEMLLYQAARAQIVETKVRPALEMGRTVILDRYIYSTIAYQGYGLGLDPKGIHATALVATGGLEPDHVVFLDLTPEQGLGRISGPQDRIEGRPLDFHRRVRAGFLAQAESLASKATVVDATAPAEDVAAAILHALPSAESR
jgi:dTMP kinase